MCGFINPKHHRAHTCSKCVSRLFHVRYSPHSVIIHGTTNTINYKVGYNGTTTWDTMGLQSGIIWDYKVGYNGSNNSIPPQPPDPTPPSLATAVFSRSSSPHVIAVFVFGFLLLPQPVLSSPFACQNPRAIQSFFRDGRLMRGQSVRRPSLFWPLSPLQSFLNF